MSTPSLGAIKNGSNNSFTIRLLDILISIPGIIFSLPIIVIIAIAIKIENRKGPVFFIQSRLGHNRKPFNLYKFRTMKVNAEENGPVWSTENDTRITKIGGFLRATRLDELPQFYNIFKGDLCLIGPRPIRAHFAEILQAKDVNYNKRFLVKPGLTGWAQLYAPYGSTIEEQLEKIPYDLRYLDGISITDYMKLLFSTVRIMLKGKGI